MGFKTLQIFIHYTCSTLDSIDVGCEPRKSVVYSFQDYTLCERVEANRVRNNLIFTCFFAFLRRKSNTARAEQDLSRRKCLFAKLFFFPESPIPICAYLSFLIYLFIFYVCFLRRLDLLWGTMKIFTLHFPPCLRSRAGCSLPRKTNVP